MLRTNQLVGFGGKREAASGFDPLGLFAGATDGFLFDASDSGSTWQDTSATTGAGEDDPVGRWNDLSSVGSNATQATDARRPILRQTGGGFWYMEGVRSELRALILGVGQNTRVLVAGVMPVTATAVLATLVASSATADTGNMRTQTSGNFWRAPPGATSGTGFDYAVIGASGTCRVNGVATDAFTRNTPHVLTVTRGSASASLVASIFSNGTGARVWEGGLFTLFGLDRDLTTDERADMEQWTADKCGVTL